MAQAELGIIHEQKAFDESKFRMTGSANDAPIHVGAISGKGRL